MTQSPNSQLEIKRIIKAEPELIYDALIKEEKLRQWFYPKPEGWKVEVYFSAKPGSNYNLTMIDSGGKEYVHTGEIKETVENKRISFTWNTEHVQNSLVTITLKKVPGGTKITLIHDFLPEDMKAGHREGWMELIEQLTELLNQLKKVN